MANIGFPSWKVCHKSERSKANAQRQVCALIVILSRQVTSEQFTAMVKQNEFQFFFTPVFHTVNLLYLWLSVSPWD